MYLWALLKYQCMIRISYCLGFVLDLLNYVD